MHRQQIVNSYTENSHTSVVSLSSYSIVLVLVLIILLASIFLGRIPELVAQENTNFQNIYEPNPSNRTGDSDNINTPNNSPVLSSTSSAAKNSSPLPSSGPTSLGSGINVDTYPVGIAVNPSTGKVYVANELSNTVSVISTNTMRIEKTIGVENFPYDIDLNLLNNRIYTTNRGSNSVSVIDGSTDSVLYNISVGQSPVGIAVNPAASWIYVANLESGSISVIDGITNTVDDTIRLDGIPYGVAVNPLTNRIYVTDLASNSIHVIDAATNKLLDDVEVGTAPAGIAIDLRSNTIYVTNRGSDDLSVINGSTSQLMDNIPLNGNRPVGVAINHISDRLYISNIGSDSVSVVDISKIGNTTLLKNIAVNPSMKNLSNQADSPVNFPVIVDFPLVASFISFDPTDNLAYFTNTASNTVSVIDGETDSLAINLMFDSAPLDSGDIECNGVIRLSENSTLYNMGDVLQCTAIPERGYIFDSWTGIANDLSSNPLTMEVSEFGTLTANFKPALSPEVYIFMLGGMVGASSIFLGWYYKYGQRRYTKKYLTRIETTYETLRNEDKEQCIMQLQNIRRELLYLFKKGSLSDSHYNILDKKALDYIDSTRHEGE